MKLIVTFSMLIALLGFAGHHAVADAETDKEQQVGSADLDIDLAPPDLAAFTLLGINSNQVARPASAKELAFAFINAGGSGTNVAPNVAFEWSPARTFGKQDLQSYKNRSWWIAPQISFATGQDSVGRSVAAGLRWVLIDQTDPLTDEDLTNVTRSLLEDPGADSMDALYFSYVNDSVMPVLRALLAGVDGSVAAHVAELSDLLNPDKDDSDYHALDPLTADAAYERLAEALSTFGVEVDQLTVFQKGELEALCAHFIELVNMKYVWAQDATTRLKAAKETFKKSSWNKWVLHFAVGFVGTSEEGTWKGLRTSYIRSYGGVACPLGRKGRLVAQGSYDNYARSDGAEDWAYSLGLRGLFGGSDVRGTLEAYYMQTKYKTDTPDEKEWRLTAGAEVRLGTGLWLEIGLGNEATSGDIKAGEILTLANLKYSFNPSARTKLPNPN